jgi:NADH dehydrogenase
MSASVRPIISTSRGLGRAIGTSIRPTRAVARAHHAQSRPLSILRQLNGSASSTHLVRAQRPSILRHTSRRFLTTNALPTTNSRFLRFCYRSAAWIGISITVLGAGVIIFFIYDATTYSADPEVSDLEISEIALNPRRGGPKNLPIIEHFIDDDETPEKKNQKHKPKVVILGTGWGSVALLKTLHPDEYHVTVVSPSNHFLFTPMLPSATVGTLELRSLVEPVRKIVAGVRGHFLKATAEEVEFSEKLIECASIGPDGEERRFYLPYDKLVLGVGMHDDQHTAACTEAYANQYPSQDLSRIHTASKA